MNKIIENIKIFVYLALILILGWLFLRFLGQLLYTLIWIGFVIFTYISAKISNSVKANKWAFLLIITIIASCLNFFLKPFFGGVVDIVLTTIGAGCFIAYWIINKSQNNT